MATKLDRRIAGAVLLLLLVVGILGMVWAGVPESPTLAIQKPGHLAITKPGG